jgi:hypothetical protein
VPELPLLPDVTWRTIDQLARRVGGYCWWEHKIFELTGRWASGTGDPEHRVLFGEMSARHATFSLQWRDRLPARAGVDVTALVVAPSRADADVLTFLDGQSDDLLRLGGLIEVVLPRLHSAYRAHLTQASAVSEGPVIEVLRQIAVAGDREIGQAQALLRPDQRSDQGPGRPGRSGRPTPHRAGNVAEFCGILERSFEAASDKSPAAWAS